MSIWSRISDAIAALAAGEGLSVVFDRLRTPPDRTVAFTIAVIALGAKMAKADGLVTRDEVTAFREVFHIPPAEEQNAARVFNMARSDIAGFEEYARRIKRLYGNEMRPLENLIEGLFHIAVADGQYHVNEDAFLARVSDIWGFSAIRFSRIRAQFVPDAERDPYDVLGVPAGADFDTVRKAWRAQVRATHPDQLMASGAPDDAVKAAEKQLIAINRAWEQIASQREQTLA